MICPVAPPSAANAKISGAHWLNRLRSSRGFPPADGVDLGHFLAAAEPPSLPSPPAASESRDGEARRRLGERKGDDVADILCELFIMGGEGRGRGRGEASNCESSKRRSSRKQRNPRFWDAMGSSKKSSNDCSLDDLRRGNNENNVNSNSNGLNSSGDNSLNRNREERDSKSAGELGLGFEEEEEEVDLKGYSKSEVTVIDSSIQGWRSKMFVFRKRKSKSVWKVREKKSKSRSLKGVRKKRKLVKSNSSDKEDNDDEKRRRRKKKKKIVRVSDSKEDAVVPLINEGPFKDDKVEVDRVALLRGEAPVKSFPCSSSHWKLKSQASSVILVRPISMFDKIGTRKREKSPTTNGQSPL